MSNPVSKQRALESKITSVAVLLLALGLLHAAAGFASLAGAADLASLGMDWKFAVLGVVYVALAYGTWRRSRNALIAATVLFGGHAALLAAQLVNGDVKMPISGILIRTLLTLPLVDGISALSRLEQERALTPANPVP
jgi:hypothetical protein